MPEFKIVEQQGLKMIEATIQDETIRAEAGALHFMRGRVEMETQMPSAKGFLKSMVTQETVFKPTYKGTGKVYFGPPIFGEYMVMDLAGEAWVLDKGAYVCSSAGIEVGAFRNKAVASMFGGEGWFQTKVEGTGQVVIQAQGPMHAIDLKNERLTVDGSFAVARQASLEFQVQKATKSILGSMASGEGLVNVIQGTGRVYLAPVPNLYANLLENLTSTMGMAAAKSK